MTEKIKDADERFEKAAEKIYRIALSLDININLNAVPGEQDQISIRLTDNSLDTQA